MTAVIVDASVGVKWFFEEKDSRLAESVRTSGALLIVPDLFAVEFANAVRKRIYRGNRRLPKSKITLPQAQAVMAQLEDEFHSKSLVIIPSRDFVARAVDIADSLDHQVADCLYLAVAEYHMKGKMVTADEAFARKTTNTEWAEFILPLSEFDDDF